MPTNADAERVLTQQRLGAHSFEGQSVPITRSCVAKFLADGVLSIDSTIYAPDQGLLCVFKSCKRLNTWVDERVVGRIEDVPHCEEMLKVIRNSLCAEPDELPLQDMLDEINSDRPTKFRWVMHWLAYRFQRAGCTPFTNLWFVGESRGIGKGTLIGLMGYLIGGINVGKVNQSDVEKGWSDSLANRELLEWDEFKSVRGLHDLSDFIKRVTGNPTIQTNKRNVGGTESPNVAMHIFSTNQPNPMMTDKNDRQNTFIGTTTDMVKWEERCKALYDHSKPAGVFADARLISGFAGLLSGISIDLAFVNRPLVTEKAMSLRMRSQDTFLRWVCAGKMVDAYRMRGFHTWEDLFDRYVSWVRDYALHSKPCDLNEFKERMRAHKIVKAEDESRKNVSGCEGSRRVPICLDIKPSQHGGVDEDGGLDEADDAGPALVGITGGKVRARL